MPVNRTPRRLGLSGRGERPTQVRKREPVACQRCHVHKIKCSGEQPCTKCQQSGHAAGCNYPTRDRKVKVAKSYLEGILAENRQLTEQLVASQNALTGHQQTNILTDANDIEVKNPLVGERAWFQIFESSIPPIYIGEAACSAFAGRLRQFLTGDKLASHITRIEYTKDASILTTKETQWPDFAEAQLLVKVAINHICKSYHVVLKESTLIDLENLYRTVKVDDLVMSAKYFALFALGEAYSGRASQNGQVPGLAYFAKALDVIKLPPERPSIMHIGTLLLLALYSFFLDRRHSGYVLISDALRHGVTIGLHHNIPESQLIGAVEREHRVRIWWTAYILDREWSATLGFPSHLLDRDIYVNMPSNLPSVGTYIAQFPEDTDGFSARVRLARIIGETVTNLYTHGDFEEPFLVRIQKALVQLKLWVQSLPESIELDFRSSRGYALQLRLLFNQAVILATRPVLLFLLKFTRGGDDRHNMDMASFARRSVIIPALVALAKTCVVAARDSHSLLADQWIEGHFPILSYFYAHRLFSVALALAASSVMGEENRNSSFDMTSIYKHTDMGGLQAAMGMLRSMSGSGNLAAAEHLKNLHEVKSSVDAYATNSSLDQRSGNSEEKPAETGPVTQSTITSTTLTIIAAVEELEVLHNEIAHRTGSVGSRLCLAARLNNLNPTSPASMLQHQSIARDSQLQSEVQSEVSQPWFKPPQQEPSIDEYGAIDDEFFNWDGVGSLWAE